MGLKMESTEAGDEGGSLGWILSELCLERQGYGSL